MRNDRLNFGVILRVMMSLLPILFGVPTVGIIFCAYNLAMSYIVFGPMTALVSSLCAICFSMFFGSSLGVEAELSGLIWGIQAVLCAAGCVYGIGYKRKFYNALCLSSLGVLIPELLYTRYQAFSEGLSVADLLVPSTDFIKAMMGSAFSQLNAAGISQDVVEKAVTLVRDITTMLIPSALIVSSMMIAYATLWAVAAQLRRVPPFKMIHSFSHIKVSRLTVIFTALFFSLCFISGVRENKVLITAAANMLMILSSMSFFAGISLADFYMRKFIRMTFVRVILHLIIVINLSPIYIIAAFIDAFFNFRKLKSDEEDRREADETEKRDA